jgi:hypothetical protein
MGHSGISEEIGLATMLLMRVLMIPYSLVGGGLYFIVDRDAHDMEPMPPDGVRHVWTWRASDRTGKE